MSPSASTTWEVWGTYAYVGLEDGRLLPEGVALARTVLADVDLACSRFRPDSELSRVNAHPGRTVEAGPLLVAALRAALDAARVSGGLVDPCLGRSMVALGYDRDLEEVVATVPANLPNPPPRPGAWTEVRVWEDAVRVPSDVALDLGATAKAWAADLLASMLAEQLGTVSAVSLGGDVSVREPACSWGSTTAAWPVRIAEHPRHLDDGVDVLVTGGLATSSTMVRRWRAGGIERHHLLDPRTGQPTTGAFRSVTAIGRTCLAANTATTAAVVLGKEAPAWLTARDVAARLVAADGTITTVAGWPEDNREESR